MTTAASSVKTDTGKALDGVRILDMTHVQSGPSCTQILAWLGADVIKLELPGRGDVTRQQLRDIPDVDSLYFTLLNGNKRSLTLNTKTAQGKEILTRLVERCDVLVENFGPGVLDRQGFSWHRLQEINPRLIYASIKGFGPGRFAEAKAYEPIAQAMGGAMSTTGFEDGPPLVTGAQIGDSGTGIQTVAAILAALYQRDIHTGRGQRVVSTMQDSVLNLCRVKMRDQQRLARGPLHEYPNQKFDSSVPRSGNASGGGHPGAALRCAPSGPNDYVYLIIQPQKWEVLCNEMERPELVSDPRYATPEARVPILGEVFAIIEEWTKKHTKYEVLERCNAIDVPCGPVLEMKELLEDESLRSRGMIVQIEHPQRGTYYTIGCPFMLSDTTVQYKRAPLLGEQNEEILREFMGYDKAQIDRLRAEGVI
jgi:formyl-CoA transferase